MNKLCTAVLSIAFGATLFFFAPADIFLANQSDFIVNTARMLIPLGLMAFSASLSALVLLLILRKINHKVCSAVSCLLLGIVGAAYFQMTFFNGHMAVMDGREVDYDKFDLYNTADFIFFFLILMLPLILWAAREQYKNNKWLRKLDSAKVSFLCITVIVMQLSGTLTLAVQNGVHNNPSDITLPMISYKPAMNISKDRNIVVFLVDKLDGNYADDMIERYPDMSEKLDGFTLYRDNLSEHCFTFPSITQMLTGVEYKEEGLFGAYLSDAWSGNNLPRILHDSGWNVYLMIDRSTTYNDITQIDPFIDNTADYSYGVNYTGRGGICRSMINLSLYKCLPYRYKTFFKVKYSNIANGFFVFDDEENADSVFPSRVGIESDIHYYNYISHNDLLIGSEQPTFSFIHLNAAHDPSDELSALYKGFDGKCDNVSTARGSFESIFRYIDELKRLDVYDNTTIILLADHGEVPDYIDARAISAPDTAALFIKPAGSRGLMTVDDHSQLSNKNLAASVLEYAGLDHAAFGDSYNDIIRNGGTQQRIFNATNYYNYGMEGVGEFSNFTERIVYRVDGNSRDFENWELISDSYT